MAPSRDFWLYRWIDEFEIHSVSQVDFALSSPAAVARLHDLARESFDRDEIEPVNDRESTVVVGRTLDLEGPYGCKHPDCQKTRLHKAFLSVWHYFDRIVVSGPSDVHVISIIESSKSQHERLKDLRYYLENAISTLLYLRSIGATGHIEFRDKEHFDLCDRHFDKRAHELELNIAADDLTKQLILDEFERNGKLHIDKRDGWWWYVLHHPVLPEPFMGYVSRRKPSRREVLEEFFKDACFELIRDVQLSQDLALPLTQEAQLSLLSRPGKSGSPTPESVALRIAIPTPREIDTPTLLRMMEEDEPQLVRFRAAIRHAITERIKDGSDPPEHIAKTISRDIIEPELADIRRRLATARRNLVKKTATNFSVGTAVVTVGVITAMPLVVGLGATALASQLVDSKKYFEDRSTIEQSDMYFLWKMQGGG